MFGTSVKLAASSWDSRPFRFASVTIFRTAASRTFTVEGDRSSIEVRYSIRSARVRGRLAAKAKSRSRPFAYARRECVEVTASRTICRNWSCAGVSAGNSGAPEDVSPLQISISAVSVTRTFYLR